MNRKMIFLLAALLLTGCQPRSAQTVQEAPSGEVSISQPAQKDAEEGDFEDEGTLQPESGEQASFISDSSGETDESETTSNNETDLNSNQSRNEAKTVDWSLILVNYDHGIDITFEPELEAVQGIYQMDARVAPIMKQMIADAQEQGISLLVCSAYRPYSSQQRNFNNSVQSYRNAGYSEEQAVEVTLRLIAAPGTSEHQTGLAADIVTPSYQSLNDGYADTAAAKWLYENAARYGFILRYPPDKTEITRIDFEPWHYRYVGVEAAEEIMASGLCLEEYLEGVG